VSAADVLADQQSGGQSWEAHVPEAVAALIKQRLLFGCPDGSGGWAGFSRDWPRPHTFADPRPKA
jgi:hypothetical protein